MCLKRSMQGIQAAVCKRGLDVSEALDARDPAAVCTAVESRTGPPSRHPTSWHTAQATATMAPRRGINHSTDCIWLAMPRDGRVT